jgi:hypothetical protein
MRWDRTTHAGFSSVEPWLPLGDALDQHSVSPFRVAAARRSSDAPRKAVRLSAARRGRETDAEKRWRARALRCQAVQSLGAQHADMRNDFRPPGRGPAMEGAKLIPSLLSYFGSARTEDRAASEAVHCWGRRMSFNVSSHKISGLRSPALKSAMSFVAMACLMSSSQSPVRRAMQTISSATLRTRVLSGSNRSPLRSVGF